MDYTTTREAYGAYVQGRASLDDASRAANRTIGRHLQNTGRTWPDTVAPSPNDAKTQQS